MIDPKTLLAGIPDGLRAPLLSCYREIVINFADRRWEPAELNGGKFCEVVYTIVTGYLKGSFSSSPSKPLNFPKACSDIESQNPPNPSRAGDRSIRILIPRILPPLYDIRNNRGVGHVGGDVDPNMMDAIMVRSMASWILAELVRIFHGCTTTEAQDTVDALVERATPLVWAVEDKKRVLNPDIGTKDQALLLLSGEPGGVLDKMLFEWLEYSSLSMFRTRILKPLHSERLIEYNAASGMIYLSPIGAKKADNLLRSQVEP